MPLSLNDPRWAQLSGSYGNTKDIVAWLSDAYAGGGMSEERLGELVNEVQRQGGTSTAMYAVAGHLLELARAAEPKAALGLLTQAGCIHAAARGLRAIPCPSFLEAEFLASVRTGAKQLTALLPDLNELADFHYAVTGLAGLVGHHAFGRFLMGVNFYQGKFFHSSVEGEISFD